MAYEQKPGDGSLFKNDKKESDKHPDYKGSITCPVCKTVQWLSAWVKRSADKPPFMSLSAKPKDQPKPPPTITVQPASQTMDYNPDDCPF